MASIYAELDKPKTKGTQLPVSIYSELDKPTGWKPPEEPGLEQAGFFGVPGVDIPTLLAEEAGGYAAEKMGKAGVPVPLAAGIATAGSLVGELAVWNKLSKLSKLFTRGKSIKLKGEIIPEPKPSTKITGETMPEISIKEPIINRIEKAHTETGGSTFNIKTGENLLGKDLYSVGIGETEKIPGNITGKDFNAKLSEFITKNEDLLKNKNITVGSWFNKKTNETVFDIVTTTKNKKLAQFLGEKYNQESIFNLKKGEEIITGGTGTIPESIIPTKERFLENIKEFQKLKGQKVKFPLISELLNKAKQPTASPEIKEFAQVFNEAKEAGLNPVQMFHKTIPGETVESMGLNESQMAIFKKFQDIKSKLDVQFLQKAILPKKEVLGEAGRLGKPKTPEIEFSNPEVKKQVRFGRTGVPIKESLEKIGGNISNEIKKFQFEPTLKAYPELVNNIRTELIPAPRRAIKQADLALQDIVYDLDKNEINQVFDIAWLRDFKSRGIADKKLPGNLKVSDITLELDNLEKQVSPKILEKVNKIKTTLETIRKDLVERGVLDETQNIEDYMPHYIYDLMPEGFDRFLGILPKRLKKAYRGYAKTAVGSERSVYTSPTSYSKYLSTVYMDNTIDDFAVKQLTKYDIAAKLTKEQKMSIFGDITAKPKHKYIIDNKEYVGFQFVPGRVIYPAEALTPIEGLTKEVGALGRYRKVYVLPKEIAERFEKLKTPASDVPGLYNIIKATGAWKRVTLDVAGLPFQVGNFFGDFINLFKTAPAAAGKIPTALKLLLTKEKNLTPAETELIGFLKQHDIVDSGFIREYAPILLKHKLNPFYIIEEFSAIREAILRSAMGIHQYERLKLGLPVNPGEINIAGLDSLSAAGKIAREFSVDYSAVSPAYRNYIRGLILPFARFYEANFRNWVKFAGKEPTRFTSTVVAPIVAASVYNNTGNRKQIEENLPEYYRWIPHLIVRGIDINNDNKPEKAIVFSLRTPVDMAASFLGLERISDKITKIRKGTLSVQEAAKEQIIDMGLAVPRQVIKLLNPAVQMIVGLLNNKDPFTKQTIVPQKLKGTKEEKKLYVNYIINKFSLPLAQYAALEKGTEPLTNPITDWFLNAAGNWKKALGYNIIDLTKQPIVEKITKETGLKGDLKSYLYEIERNIINIDNQNDLLRANRDVILEARKEGFYLTPDSISSRFKNPFIRIERIKRQLRGTPKDQETKRNQLENELLRWQKIADITTKPAIPYRKQYLEWERGIE